MRDLKKFVFSLEKVLDLNDQMLDVLKGELSELQMKLGEIDRKIQQLTDCFKQKNLELKAELENGISVHRMTQYKLYFTQITAQLNRLAADRIQCEKAIEAKKQELVELKSRISGLEKLKEKQQQEYQSSLQKTEERNLEEFVSRSLLSL